MLEVATNFYKTLFAYEPKPDLHLGNGFWSETEMISEELQRDLERSFSED